jgi:putative transcriptional regulator
MNKRELERIAKAIEADAGEALPELREALREAADRKGRVTTPEQALVCAVRVPSERSQVDGA